MVKGADDIIITLLKKLDAEDVYKAFIKFYNKLNESLEEAIKIINQWLLEAEKRYNETDLSELIRNANEYIRKAIEFINQEDLKEVLDIGTGSGCIACSIAHKTDATVLGVDISSDALRVALDNVTRLSINNRAVFRKSDLFSKVRDDEKFDMKKGIYSAREFGFKYHECLISKEQLKTLKPFDAIILKVRLMPIKTTLLPDYKINWSLENKINETFPKRTINEIKIFNL